MMCACDYKGYCGSYLQFGASACPERDCLLESTFAAIEDLQEELDEQNDKAN